MVGYRRPARGIGIGINPICPADESRDSCQTRVSSACAADAAAARPECGLCSIVNQSQQQPLPQPQPLLLPQQQQIRIKRIIIQRQLLPPEQQLLENIVLHLLFCVHFIICAAWILVTERIKKECEKSQTFHTLKITVLLRLFSDISKNTAVNI